MSHITIREATIHDCDDILQCIGELAVYERLAHEVRADTATLKQTLFGPKPYAYVLLAYADDKLAGFCVYFYNFSTFLGKPGIYIEDVFVKPDYRSFGLGKSLMSAVCEVAQQQECGRVEWSVLDWNQSAVDFYTKLGAQAMSDWTVYRLSEDKFTALRKSA